MHGDWTHLGAAKIEMCGGGFLVRRLFSDSPLKMGLAPIERQVNQRESVEVSARTNGGNQGEIFFQSFNRRPVHNDQVLRSVRPALHNTLF
jgi:hypothetical protein